MAAMGPNSLRLRPWVPRIQENIPVRVPPHCDFIEQKDRGRRSIFYVGPLQPSDLDQRAELFQCELAQVGLCYI